MLQNRQQSRMALASNVVKRDYKILRQCMTTWKKEDPSLLSVEEIPSIMRRNNIIRGYRSCSSVVECAYSVFTYNNETVNFWTHFLGSCYFFFWLIILLESYDFYDSYNWPFLMFIFTVGLCFLMSSLAHMFSCMSARIHYAGFIIDYSTNLLVFYANNVIIRAYCISEGLLSSGFADIIIQVAYLSAFFGIIALSISRLYPSNPFLSSFRAIIFGLPYLTGTIPLVYRMVFLKDVYSRHFLYFAIQCIAMILSCFLYGSHYPERKAPGKYDFLGNSHQLMHILTVIAAIFQVKSAMIDLKIRKKEILSNNWEIANYWTSWMVLLVICWYVIIVWCFAQYIFKSESKKMERYKANTGKHKKVMN